MDTHNNFQMPSKQYLTETSEHQLESWHTAQAALLPAVSQASPRATSAACLDGHGSLKYIQQNSSTLGFTIESRCCSLWLHDIRNLSTPLEHSCAGTRGEISGHSEHESDVFPWNTFLNFWHNQFIISEIHARTWRCWDTVCRSCQHEKIILFSSYRHLNVSLLA